MSSANRSRRQFTTEQKVALLRRHLVDKEPVSKICDEAQLQPSLFYQWLRQAFDNIGAALGPPVSEPSRREKELATKNKELEAKLVKKDHVIAEVAAELIATKKELGEP
ncbi:MAG TPA: transposase [Kofleriaceae bacterium]|nr:transposase [Kofleriaceae bacterium]